MTVQLTDPVGAEWTVPRQPAVLTFLKGSGVLLSSGLFAVLLARTGVALTDASSAWLVLPALLLGYLLADLLSGSAHWFCDTFFAEDTPVIGRTVIQPFRDHHVHPRRITRYRFLEQDTTNFFLMLPLLAAACSLAAPASAAGLFWTSALLGLSAGSFATNLLHKWAHQSEPAVVVRWLQRAGLILGPERHALHHLDHSLGFCVTSGWLNPLLDALGLFPRVERVVRRIQR